MRRRIESQVRLPPHMAELESVATLLKQRLLSFLDNIE
jgi:hypothetical protein